MLYSTFFRLSSVFVSLAIAAAASPSVLSPARRDVPHGWSLTRRADPHAHIPLKFALKQSNVEKLEDFLLDVSDPLSPNYGKHWSPAKVAATFRPSEETVNTVHSWLVEDGRMDTGRVRLAEDGGHIHLDVTVAEAEELLGADYYVYQHEDGSERVGCHHGYRLPEHVSKHVDLVWPTVHFGGSTALSRRAASSSGKIVGGIERPSGAPKALAEDASMAPGPTNCDKAVTLDCLRALYNFNYTLVSANWNSAAVVEFGDNVYEPSDLNLFWQKFDPSRYGEQPTLVSIAGGHLNSSAPSGDLGESTLDFELMMGLLGAQQEVLLYQVGASNSVDFFGEHTDELLGALDSSYCSSPGVKALGLTQCGDVPKASVVSISYSTGADYFDPEETPVMQRQCTEFGKLSLTGMTFVVSSGDSGVAYSKSDVCLAKNGSWVEGNAPGVFVPQFPASCPWVTTVGATQVSKGNSVADPEVAVFSFPSGGGFSNTFPRPKFQNRAVTRYLNNYAPPYDPDVFNRSGRAYPDVSANGFPIVVARSGNYTLDGGTSASAPIFASLIVAINDARIAVGKSPVGWINPSIYSHIFRGAFNDIVDGSNPGCGTEGFPAARGWDPVTGLGTPNFQSLKARFLALP